MKIKYLILFILFFVITGLAKAQNNMKYAQCRDCCKIEKVPDDASWKSTKSTYPCPASNQTRACQFGKLCHVGATMYTCSNCNEKIYTSGQIISGFKCSNNSTKTHNWVKK